MNTNGTAGFKAKLRTRVFRKNPSLWRRFLDFLKGY